MCRMTEKFSTNETQKDEDDCVILSSLCDFPSAFSSVSSESAIVIDLTSEPDLPNKPPLFSTTTVSKSRQIAKATRSKTLGLRALHPSPWDSESPAPSFISLSSCSSSVPASTLPSYVRPLHGFVKRRRTVSKKKKKGRRRLSNSVNDESLMFSNRPNRAHIPPGSSATITSTKSKQIRKHKYSLMKLRKSMVRLARNISYLKQQLRLNIRPRARNSFTAQLRQAEQRRQLLTKQLVQNFPQAAPGVINGAFAKGAAPAYEPPAGNTNTFSLNAQPNYSYAPDLRFECSRPSEPATFRSAPQFGVFHPAHAYRPFPAHPFPLSPADPFPPLPAHSFPPLPAHPFPPFPAQPLGGRLLSVDLADDAAAAERQATDATGVQLPLPLPSPVTAFSTGVRVARQEAAAPPAALFPFAEPADQSASACAPAPPPALHLHQAASSETPSVSEHLRAATAECAFEGACAAPSTPIAASGRASSAVLSRVDSVLTAYNRWLEHTANGAQHSPTNNQQFGQFSSSHLCNWFGFRFCIRPSLLADLANQLINTLFTSLVDAESARAVFALLYCLNALCCLIPQHYHYHYSSACLYSYSSHRCLIRVHTYSYKMAEQSRDRLMDGCARLVARNLQLRRRLTAAATFQDNTVAPSGAAVDLLKAESLCSPSDVESSDDDA